MKRRTFLAGLGAGALVAGFTLYRQLPVLPSRPDADEKTALGWVSHKDGTYALHLPRIEMGQNIATGLKQVACEELQVPWADVVVKMQNTAVMEPVRATVGSESIRDFAEPLAQACAALRDALQAGRQTGEIKVEARPVEALKAFQGNGETVGRRVPIEQVRSIVKGQPVYVSDVHLDKMVYGRVLRSQTSPEIDASPLSWDLSAAQKVPGFVKLVQDNRLSLGKNVGLGIVARTPGALDAVAEALNVDWAVETTFDQSDVDRAIDIDRKMMSRKLDHEIRSDELPEDEIWDVDLRIDTPPAAHGQIEPRCAVAAVGQDGTLDLFVGHQDAFYVRDHVANLLGRDRNRVVVHAHRIGGGFGAKVVCAAESEAAILAEVTRVPVKVQWTRAQEFLFAYHRPPSSHRIRARLNNGRLDTWHHAFASSHIIFTNAAMPKWMHLATDLLVGDPGVARGAEFHYDVPAARIEYDVERLPILSGPWRGLGAGPNMLAIESAIDECAISQGVDPAEFRMKHIIDPRLKLALGDVLKLSDWSQKQRQVTSKERRGFGVACGIYKTMSYAATVAEVVVSDDGSVRVDRLWCTHDCGLVINPDQVKAQCEGNLVWGVGMVLTDNLSVGNTRIEEETFGEAPIPAMSDTPEMEISLINSSAAPTGAGETAIVSAAGAIANAVRHATGVRPVRFPLDPDLLVRPSG